MPAFLNFEDYTIAWIAPLRVEAKAALALMKRHAGGFPSVKADDYIYIGGEIGGHNVVLATLPKGQNYGTNSAASLVNQVKLRFPSIWFALLVGVAAGLPNVSPKNPKKRRDIRLGDVLVCVPDKKEVGIVHYDQGTDNEGEFVLSDRQAETPAIVRSAFGHIELTEPRAFKKGNIFASELEALLSALRDDPDDEFICPSQETDQLHEYISERTEVFPKLVDRSPRNESERTKIWYGSLGSGNSLMRNHNRRDELRDKYELIGLEMEAAGTMNTLPTGMIRGVCDYGDAYKNKDWQPYAAAVAAVYAKGVLEVIQVKGAIPPRSTPIPFSTLPQILAPHFTGREKYFREIDTKFQGSMPSNQRVVLWGLEGIGKSQIAMKYAKNCSSNCSTFWIKASTRKDVISGLERIVFVMRKGKQDRDMKVSLHDEIHELLDNEKAGEWLLVLDGADDKDIFMNQRNGLPSLDNYIPNVSHGRVLITTTDARILGLNQGYFAPAQNGINVTPLTTTESVELLQNSIPPEFHVELGLDDEPLRIELVKLLNCLPIALSHTIAQIREDSVPLEEFIQNYLNMRNSTNTEVTGMSPDPGLATFELSYRRLCETNQPHEKLPEAQLLDLMACFDGREIPRKSLLDFYKTEFKSVKPFSAAMGRLRNLSLVEYTALTDAYWILSIIQSWTYQRLSNGEKTYYEGLVTRALMAAASKTPSRLVRALRTHQANTRQPERARLDDHLEYSLLDDAPFYSLRILGRGASSVVREVQKTSGADVGRIYARKELRLGDQSSFVLKFGRREVEILKQLKHKHIIECVSTISTPDIFAIILSPVGECDLASFIGDRDRGRLNVGGLFKEKSEKDDTYAMIRRWFGCLAEAVDFIHGHGILLADVKPDNIIINKGEVLLIDFGYSISSNSLPVDSRSLPFTLNFTAPETLDLVTGRRSLGTSAKDIRISEMSQPALFDEVTSIQSHYIGSVDDCMTFPTERLWTQATDYMGAPETTSLLLVLNYKSDIYSLGCVFLEILTCLMDESSSDFVSYRRGSRGGDVSYSNNMERVLRWMWYLFTKYGESGHGNYHLPVGHDASTPQNSCASLVGHVVQWCFLMLQPLPQNRCSATQLIRRMSVSRLPVFCGQCERKLAPHERSLPLIHITKAPSPEEALEGYCDLTWEIVNEWWASDLKMESGPLSI